MFFAIGITQYKAIFSDQLMNSFPDLRIPYQIFIFVDYLAINDQDQIQCQSGMVFGITGSGDCLGCIVVAIFLCEIINDLLLYIDASERRIKIDPLSTPCKIRFIRARLKVVVFNS